MLVSVENLLLFAYIYLFCFLGAFSKDILDTFLAKAQSIFIFKIITSSLAVAILLYGGSEYLLDKMSFKPFTTLCYIFGIISFEIMTRYSNVKEIFELVHEFKIWMKNKK